MWARAATSRSSNSPSLIASVVGFDGEIVRDTTKPDGTPRKLMDSGRLTALGWEPQHPAARGRKADLSLVSEPEQTLLAVVKKPFAFTDEA